MITEQYGGTKIGLIFTIINLLTTWTYVVPLITISPLILYLENSFRDFNNNESYYIIGPYILKMLWIIFITISAIFFSYVFVRIKYRKSISKVIFILFLILQAFIIHPLFFYIDTSQNWSRASDGQFIMGVTETFPISSFSFVFLGFILDLIRNHQDGENLEKHDS